MISAFSLAGIASCQPVHIVYTFKSRHDKNQALCSLYFEGLAISNSILQVSGIYNKPLIIAGLWGITMNNSNRRPRLWLFFSFSGPATQMVRLKWQRCWFLPTAACNILTQPFAQALQVKRKQKDWLSQLTSFPGILSVSPGPASANNTFENHSWHFSLGGSKCYSSHLYCHGESPLLRYF